MVPAVAYSGAITFDTSDQPEKVDASISGGLRKRIGASDGISACFTIGRVTGSS